MQFWPRLYNLLPRNAQCPGNRLRADHNTNIHRIIPSDSSKQTMQSSLCASYCIVTAHLLYNHSLDIFPHYLTEEDVTQFVLLNYGLK